MSQDKPVLDHDDIMLFIDDLIVAHPIYTPHLRFLRDLSLSALERQGVGLSVHEADVIAAAVQLAPLLEEGWDEYDSDDDQKAGTLACDALVKAVNSMLSDQAAPSPAGPDALAEEFKGETFCTHHNLWHKGRCPKCPSKLPTLDWSDTPRTLAIREYYKTYPIEALAANVIWDLARTMELELAALRSRPAQMAEQDWFAYDQPCEKHRNQSRTFTVTVKTGIPVCFACRDAAMSQQEKRDG